MAAVFYVAEHIRDRLNRGVRGSKMAAVFYVAEHIRDRLNRSNVVMPSFMDHIKLY